MCTDEDRSWASATPTDVVARPIRAVVDRICPPLGYGLMEAEFLSCSAPPAPAVCIPGDTPADQVSMDRGGAKRGDLPSGPPDGSGDGVEVMT
jgi:hypothetical protein